MTGTTHQHDARPPPDAHPACITNAMDANDIHGRAREQSRADPGVTISLDTRPLFIEGVISASSGSHFGVVRA